MKDFALGHWGTGSQYFTEDAFLISFLDDRTQALLEWHASPIVLTGHLGLARYSATVGAYMSPFDYELVSVTPVKDKIATEVAWSAKSRRTNDLIEGYSCNVWFTTPDYSKFCGVITTNWTFPTAGYNRKFPSTGSSQKS